MVLKTEACPEGLQCANKDCPYSHVSPAQALGDAAGQSRVPCKFGNKCNNPACSFRHEDAAGNLVPTPALSRPAAVSGPIDVDMADPSQHDELDITLDLDSSAAGMASRPIAGVPGKKMDGTLGSSSGGVVKPMNGQIKVPCRFGEGCTRGNCRFQHGKACRFGKKCFDRESLTPCRQRSDRSVERCLPDLNAFLIPLTSQPDARSSTLPTVNSLRPSPTKGSTITREKRRSSIASLSRTRAPSRPSCPVEATGAARRGKGWRSRSRALRR